MIYHELGPNEFLGLGDFVIQNFENEVFENMPYTYEKYSYSVEEQNIWPVLDLASVYRFLAIYHHIDRSFNWVIDHETGIITLDRTIKKEVWEYWHEGERIARGYFLSADDGYYWKLINKKG